MISLLTTYSMQNSQIRAGWRWKLRQPAHARVSAKLSGIENAICISLSLSLCEFMWVIVFDVFIGFIVFIVFIVFIEGRLNSRRIFRADTAQRAHTHTQE